MACHKLYEALISLRTCQLSNRQSQNSSAAPAHLKVRDRHVLLQHSHHLQGHHEERQQGGPHSGCKGEQVLASSTTCQALPPTVERTMTWQAQQLRGHTKVC